MPEYHHGLVSAETVFENIDNPGWVVFDVRHALTDPEWGPKEYAKGHVPGAYHAHIDRDLSGPRGDGHKGRHPLPIPGVFQRFLQTFGVDDDTQVAVYDDAGGIWAARLWWLLRHYGHENVAVIDGGLQRWKSLGLPVTKDRRRPKEGHFGGRPGSMPTIDAIRITADFEAEAGAFQLVDARAPERYHGEVEPIDPVAGHIPGAMNLHFAGNLEPDGRFLSPDELRARYESALGVQEAGKVAVYCGSGVTSAHNVLALEIAGMGTAALYPGSWSEWCRPDAERPVEKTQNA